MSRKFDKRKRILEFLRDLQGKWASGQKIADELKISRNGVSKHVKILREMGYEIEASTKKGYMYLSETKNLNKYEIESDDEDRVIGKQVFLHKQVRSTNKRAQMISMSDDIHEGTVIIAEHQLSGRGRRRSVWPTFAKQGLYYSVLLYPDCVVEQTPGIIFALAYSIVETIKDLYELEDVKLDLPNSITINGKKVGGILIDNITEVEDVKTTIAGVGIYTTLDREDEQTQGKYCISDFYNGFINRNDFMSKLLENFDKEYKIFKNQENLKENTERWSTCVDQLNKKVDLILHQRTGTILGMDENFKIKFENRNGYVERIRYYEIDIKQ